MIRLIKKGFRFALCLFVLGYSFGSLGSKMPDFVVSGVCAFIFVLVAVDFCEDMMPWVKRKFFTTR